MSIDRVLINPDGFVIPIEMENFLEMSGTYIVPWSSDFVVLMFVWVDCLCELDVCYQLLNDNECKQYW